MENFSDLVKKSRSTRRFDEAVPVREEQLRAIAGLLRYVPSGTNRQALKVLVSADGETNGKIFPLLGWAALLSSWSGPQRGQRPTGYLVLLADTAIARPKNLETDLGIAAQTMALAAASQGLGTCMMGAFSKVQMKQALGLPEHLEPLLVLAMGKPRENIVLVDMRHDGSTAYFRDKSGTHFVPKRPLADFFVEP